MAREFVRFSNMADAEAFADAREAEGFDSVSVITNMPHPGSFEVRWGHLSADRENGFDYEMRMIAKIHIDREAEAEAQFTKDCERKGRADAGRDAAQIAGYSGRDAEVFCDGFRGISAKIVNPRAEGRESIFLAGRAAWGSHEGQRSFRAASVAARSVIEKVPAKPFNPGLGLIANGEH